MELHLNYLASLMFLQRHSCFRKFDVKGSRASSWSRFISFLYPLGLTGCTGRASRRLAGSGTEAGGKMSCLVSTEQANGWELGEVMGIISHTELSSCRLVVFLIVYVRRTSIKIYQYLVDCEKNQCKLQLNWGCPSGREEHLDTELIQQNTLFLKPCNTLEIESRSNKISHPPGRSFSPILWIAFAEDQTLSFVPWVESYPLPKCSCWQIFSAGFSFCSSCRAKVPAEGQFFLHLIFLPWPTDWKRALFLLVTLRRHAFWYLHPSSLVASEMLKANV